MIYEDSIRFNKNSLQFQGRALFCSDNYFGIVSGYACKKRGSIRSWDQFRVDLGIILVRIISGAVQHP